MPYSPTNTNDDLKNKRAHDTTSKEAGNEVKHMVEAFERKLARQ